MTSRVSIVSGYFAPIGVHHLNYFEKAHNYGALLVIVNNDKQVKLKGSYEFLPEEDRVRIIKNIKNVSYVYLSIDEDRSVVKTLEKIKSRWSSRTKFTFCNGGDVTEETANQLEVQFCKENNIDIVYNVGGGKTGSSSSTLQNFLNKYWHKASIEAISEEETNGYPTLINVQGWYSGPIKFPLDILSPKTNLVVPQCTGISIDE